MKLPILDLSNADIWKQINKVNEEYNETKLELMKLISAMNGHSTEKVQDLKEKLTLEIYDLITVSINLLEMAKERNLTTDVDFKNKMLQHEIDENRKYKIKKWIELEG